MVATAAVAEVVSSCGHLMADRPLPQDDTLGRCSHIMLMALNVGSQLGHYDVTALFGEGGMGRVYRAADGKLDHDVALQT